MGCTWISVVSLTVLIFISYMENMKAATYLPSTVQDETETIVSTIPPMSSTYLSTDYNITKIDTVGKRCRTILNDTVIDKNNVSESSNCTYVEHETTEVNIFNSITPVTSRVTYRDFPEYTKYKTLGNLLPYIGNIPGFVTNSLTIMVAYNIKPVHTSEIYMLLLGCADLLTVTARFVARLKEKYLERKTAADCKLIVYLLIVGQVYSNLILVSWTIERFIAVIYPIKLASWCSIRNTKVTLALLLLFSIVTSIPYTTDYTAVSIWNGREMVNVCKFTKFMLAVWFNIESVYYIYIPITVVCVCNMAILCRLNAMTQARISMAINQELIDKKAKENRKMTILLLCISGTFLILHIPNAIVMVIDYMYSDITVLLIEDPHAFAKYLFYTLLGLTITEFQNSINFFLYCLSGTKFKSTLRKLICRCITVKSAEAEQTPRTRNTQS